MKQKSTKKRFSSFATLLTVIVLIAVVLLNAVTMLLSDRFNLKLDLTPTSAYTLTQETKKILSEVDKDIKITVLSEESSFICGGGASLDPYYSQANTVINLIASQKPNISVSYVDLDKNPNLGYCYRFSSVQMVCKKCLSPSIIMWACQNTLLKNIKSYKVFLIICYLSILNC